MYVRVSVVGSRFTFLLSLSFVALCSLDHSSAYITCPLLQCRPFDLMYLDGIETAFSTLSRSQGSTNAIVISCWLLRNHHKHWVMVLVYQAHQSHFHIGAPWHQYLPLAKIIVKDWHERLPTKDQHGRLHRQSGTAPIRRLGHYNHEMPAIEGWVGERIQNDRCPKEIYF